MIYFLEDDTSIRKLVMYALESQDYQAKGFGTSQTFWEAIQEEIPELVLLDIMLPDQDGLSVLEELRSKPETRRIPVIMITARNTEYDRVEGLDLGADDFIGKPFGIMELLARIRAVMRRAGEGGGGAKEYVLGDLSLNDGSHQVKVKDQVISLTNKEYSLLLLLMENQQIVLTREVLMNKVWGLEAEKENRTLDVHIRTLRAKLGDAGKYIHTVRGVGYRMELEDL